MLGAEMAPAALDLREVILSTADRPAEIALRQTGDLTGFTQSDAKRVHFNYLARAIDFCKTPLTGHRASAILWAAKEGTMTEIEWMQFGAYVCFGLAALIYPVGVFLMMGLLPKPKGKDDSE